MPTEQMLQPIRVIHIRKTLDCQQGGIHFTRPHHWGFHVLSHTWSGAVREMSAKIGQKIGNSVGEDQDAYSRAFQTHDFRQEPCYPHLMEIFRLLHADGVRYVWFDALCINQTLESEKGHEINNMGSFFSLSKGSYVLSHGFGKVNELWGDSRGVLPRWFTRVWTFQEFLLPQQVSFLVEEGVDHRFVSILNKLIKHKGKIGLCKCFLDMPSAELDKFLFNNLRDDELDCMGGFELRNPRWKSILQLFDERSPYIFANQNDDQIWTVGPTTYRYLDRDCRSDNKSNKLYRRDLVQEKKSWHASYHQTKNLGSISALKEALSETTASDDKGEPKGIICGETTCPTCGSRPMIRRAKTTDENRLSYFFDREVYLALMQCHSQILECGSKPDKPSWDIQMLRGLYCALATEGNWNPCHVICEIGWRDCTYEEDRVLAILGLLGLKLKKLRTGKSLTDQILEFAKVGGSALLIELCTLNQKGGALLHMSWAPDFHGQNEKLEHASRPTVVSMKVENLHADGHLEVKAKVLHGRVVPKNTSVGMANKTAEYCLVFEDREFPIIPLLLTTRDEEKPLQILHFSFSDDNMKEAGSFEVPMQALTGSHKTVPFPVSLLLLGEDVLERKLLLVCLSADRELHKIGCIGLDKDIHKIVHNILDSSDMQDCIIGGFGEDLTPYITGNTQN